MFSIKIAFIGLGIMGMPMAKNLYEAGHLEQVYNRSQEKADFFKGTTVEICDSPEAAAENMDVIFVMVSDSPDVEEVVLGDNGVIDGAKSGSIVVDLSSINPESSKTIGHQLEQMQIEMVDAPVSGGEQGAIDGNLAIMVGGKESIVAAVRPLLEVMGQKVTHLGPLGAGGYAKLANQMIVGIEIQAVSEAFYLAKHAGLDFENLHEAIRYGLAGSNVLDQKIGNLMTESYDPGFKVELHLKDIENAVIAAREQGLKLPFTENIKSVLEEMVDKGLGELDHSGLYKNLFE